jgi:hypothetical protein
MQMRDGPGTIYDRASSWIVVHAGARDRYQIPAAFAERSVLQGFVTDWYAKLDRQPLAAMRPFLPKALSGLLARRYTEALPSGLVVCSKSAALGQALVRFSGSLASSYRRWDRALGKRAADLAVKCQCNLFSTSYYAAEAFRNYTGKGTRGLFQVHPSPLYLRELYTGFMERGGWFERLAHEPEMALSAAEVKNWQEESWLADRIIVASNFTRTSIQDMKRPGAQVFVVAYGVDLQFFRPPADRRKVRELRCFFVGSKVARKGLHLLLEAWRELRPQNGTLRIAGANVEDSELLDNFREVGERLPRLTPEQLREEYQAADLLVLPSLAEGFGHVYLEALACGTPILGTENSAVPDLLRHGDCGFLVPAGDKDALITRLESVLSNPAPLQKMRLEARRVAEMHSWSGFRAGLFRAAVSCEGGNTPESMPREQSAMCGRESA